MVGGGGVIAICRCCTEQRTCSIEQLTRKPKNTHTHTHTPQYKALLSLEKKYGLPPSLMSQFEADIKTQREKVGHKRGKELGEEMNNINGNDIISKGMGVV